MRYKLVFVARRVESALIGRLVVFDLKTMATTTYEAISGKWGKGALPSGLPYKVKQAVRLGHDASPAYADKSGMRWWARIEPDGWECDRTGLGIHPDGNLPGTLGCIGIGEAYTASLFDMLSEGDSSLDVIEVA